MDLLKSSRARERVSLRRECEAIEIPSGEPLLLAAGTSVTITQSLGGTYAVMTDDGIMARIDAEDATALGKIPLQAYLDDEDAPLEDRVWDQLKTCFDPEIPVNIVDLGLIYECDIERTDTGAHRIDVKMTLTAPGCGMGDVLAMDVRRKLLGLSGVEEATVEIVFEPPWDRSRMSDAAKLQLGML
ncbi:MAG: putative Fe-S cluster assembly protein SufT [Polyangiaceae bacterium]